MTEIVADALRPSVFYEIANIGHRPHNLVGGSIQGIISQHPADRLSILALKPGFYPKHPDNGVPLQTYMEGMLTAAQLDVLCTAETNLSGPEVCELYRNAMPPNPEDDNRFGTLWKKNLLSYMTSAPSFSYLLAGEDAYRKARTIKRYVRGLYAFDETSGIVKNVGHVPDPQDFDISLKILFLGGLSVESLADSERI